MADTTARLKTIADGLETGFQSLRHVATGIVGLLQIGRASCAQIEQYNLQALAVFNTQRGLLDVLRSHNHELPELPAPTIFVAKGPVTCVSGKTLIALDDVEVRTTDQFVMKPQDAPSFKAWAQLQHHRSQEISGITLGSPDLPLLISGMTVTVSPVTEASLLAYLDANKANEARIKQLGVQAEQMAVHTQAQLTCYAQCNGAPCPPEACQIEPPKTGWGLLQWAGVIAITGAAAATTWWLWQRYRDGDLDDLLPESTADAIHSATTAS